MATSSSALPSFERSISLNDLDSALNVREQVERDLVVPEDAKHRFLRATPQFSFVLPSFRQFDALDFRKFLYSSLVDVEIFKELENSKILNWCKAVHAMVPLLTLGDGNCLMHAASLAMWGVNDRYQILRRAVYQSLLEDAQGMYHRRWQHEQEHVKQQFLGGYELTEEQWKEEWQQIIDLVSPTEFPRGRSGAQFGSLEETHIFVLANVLRRTIIVLCDDTLRGNYGESFSPVTFGGIYLPLNWDPLDCVKSPLVIGYAQGHFTAVVSTKDGMIDLGSHSFICADNALIKHAVPLAKPSNSPLPVHFLLASEEGQESGLLRQYLDCAKVFPGQGVTNQEVGSDAILIAKLSFSPPLPQMEKLSESYFHQASNMYKHLMTQRQAQPLPQNPPVHLPNQGSAKPCRTEGCPFFGRSESNDLCSTCLTKYLSSLNFQEPSSGATALHQQHQPVPNQQRPSVTVQAPVVTTQSSPVHRKHPTSVSATCHTSGCKYAATAGKGGLCTRCYEAERSAEEMAASVEYQSIHGEPCANKVNGCEFFGLAQQHHLCSRCYRHFCVRLEDTLGEQVPNSPSGMGGPSVPPATNTCQGANCHNEGLAVLYNMCLGCYTACIRAFINSDGKTVGNTIAPPPEAPPVQGAEAPPVQGAKPVVFKKGILCASAGCFNERIPHLNDLCSECYQSAKGSSASVTTTSHGNTPIPAPQAMARVTAAVTKTAASSPHRPPLCPTAGCSNGGIPQLNHLCFECYQSAKGLSPSVSSTYHENTQISALGAVARVTAAVTTTSASSPRLAMGQSMYCSNGKCMALIGSNTGKYCQACYGTQLAASSAVTKPADRQMSPGLPAMSPALTTPTAPYMSHSLHSQTSGMYSVPSQPGSTVPGTRMSECVASSQASVMSPGQVQEVLRLPSVTNSNPAQTTTPCATPNCKFSGSPGMNFLCSQCYQKNIAEWKRIGGDTATPGAGRLQQRERNTAGTCIMEGCRNPSGSNCNQLCNSCFQVALRQENQWVSQQEQVQQALSQTKSTESSTSGNLPRQTKSFSAAIPCKTVGCLRFGTRKKNGLCDVCFNLNLAQPAEPRLSGTPTTATLCRPPATPQQQQPVNNAPQLQATSNQAPVQVASRSIMMALQPQDVVSGQRCRQPKCSMFGTSEMGGLCSRCFAEKTMVSSYPSSVPDAPPPSPLSSTSEVSERSILPTAAQRECLNAACTNLADPHLHNHCTECFRKLYPELAQRDEYRVCFEGAN